MKFSEFILNESYFKIQDVKGIIKYFKEILKLCKELDKIDRIFGSKGVDWEGDFNRYKKYSEEGCRTFDVFIKYYIHKWATIGDPNRDDGTNTKYVKAGAKGLKVVKQIKELMDKVDSLASKNRWYGQTWDPDDYGTESFPEMIEDTLEYWDRILKEEEADAKRNKGH